MESNMDGERSDINAGQHQVGRAGRRTSQRLRAKERTSYADPRMRRVRGSVVYGTDRLWSEIEKRQLLAGLRQHGSKKVTKYLSNYRGPFTKYRYEDSFNFGTKEVRDVEELSKVPGMNPLGFHPEMLVHRHLPPLEDPKEEEGGMTNNQG